MTNPCETVAIWVGRKRACSSAHWGNRDGLMIGICNGFQALIKLGLLPYGKIQDMSKNDPTLTFNTIGRHVSQMVDTRIGSVKSPWLKYVNVDDVHTIPVSHGEGRFVAPKEVIEECTCSAFCAVWLDDSVLLYLTSSKPSLDI